jgi:hypothetical protein
MLEFNLSDISNRIYLPQGNTFLENIDSPEV